MARKGVDSIWTRFRAGFYESKDGRTIEFEDGEWWGYDKRGVPEAVFQTLKDALKIIWR